MPRLSDVARMLADAGYELARSHGGHQTYRHTQSRHIVVVTAHSKHRNFSPREVAQVRRDMQKRRGEKA